MGDAPLSSGKVVSLAALVLGSLISLTGAGLVGLYASEAIITRIGDPDQSLIFWYLPILFIGLIVLAIGLGLGVWGVYRLRKLRHG
jgi:hypothetical protein